ncbi:tRNA1(Val) (adenine(37)-N6)-methyltransferase [Holzapfeliella sp. JNUCC 72]
MTLYENEEINHLFNEKIKIIQNKTVFSFSLDTILLAYFTQIKKNSKVVDLCSGNGAASLFLTHYHPTAQIDAVEIQSDIAEMATRSVELNELSNQITVHNRDAKEATAFLKKDSYDAVICNPPYFELDSGHKVNPNEQLAIARHEIMINLEDIIKTSAGLLKTKGKLFMVHRPDRLTEIMTLMAKYDLMPRKIQSVIPKKGREANIVLVEAMAKGAMTGVKLLPEIVVHEEDNHYAEFIERILAGDRD